MDPNLKSFERWLQHEPLWDDYTVDCYRHYCIGQKKEFKDPRERIAVDRLEKEDLAVGEKFYFYGLTFTTSGDEPESVIQDCKRFFASTMFRLCEVIQKWELTKDGKPHMHLSLKASDPIYASYLKKCIKGRYRLDRLKTPIDKLRWSQYCSKKSTPEEIKYFGDRSIKILTHYMENEEVDELDYQD